MFGKLLRVLKSLFVGPTSDATNFFHLFVFSCISQFVLQIMFLKTEPDSAFYPKALNALFIVTCYGIHGFSAQYVVLLSMFGFKPSGKLDIVIEQRTQIVISLAILLSIVSIFLLHAVRFFEYNPVLSITGLIVALTFGLYRGRHLYDEGDIA